MWEDEAVLVNQTLFLFKVIIQNYTMNGVHVQMSLETKIKIEKLCLKTLTSSESLYPFFIK
jgi:hypothetical protein